MGFIYEVTFKVLVYFFVLITGSLYVVVYFADFNCEIHLFEFFNQYFILQGFQDYTRRSEAYAC